MKKGILTAVLIVLGVLIIFLGVLVSFYNGFVSSEENVNNAWAQVQTNYQRRMDLIPNLVKVVDAYADHESEVFKDIAKLRSGYQEAKTVQDYQALDASLQKSINIMVEAYPELKANENFLSLQDELAGTENRISIARKDFNDAATLYNKKIRRFPGNLFASMLGFEKRDLFQATQGAENAPDISFGN